MEKRAWPYLVNTLSTLPIKKKKKKEKRGAFWNRVIYSKYGEEGGWGTHEAGGPYGVGVH